MLSFDFSLKEFCSLLMVLFIIQNHLIAQEKEITCGYYESNQSSLLVYNKAYARHLSTNTNQLVNDFYTIPTVVHIIHNGDFLGSWANPKDDRVRELIEETTNRFRHASGKTFSNPYSGVDTQIEFCLAATDPDGNFTTGIMRHYAPYLNLDELVLSTRWDASKYCNMYIYATENGPTGVYVGKASGDVIFYNSEPQSGLMAHELGHYFTLSHTFIGCKNDNCLLDGDLVCDTPPKGAPGYNSGSCNAPREGCSTDDDDFNNRNPYRPVENGGIGNQPDMLENYMDYTAWCWDAFSIGQSERMRFDIATNRQPLINNASMACATRPHPAFDIGITNFITEAFSCKATATIKSTTIKNYGTAPISSFNIDILVNKTVRHSIHQTISIPIGETITVSLNESINLEDGDNYIELKTSLPNEQVDGFINNDWYVQHINYDATGAEVPYLAEYVKTEWPAGQIINNDTHLKWGIGRSGTTREPCYGDNYVYIAGYAPSSESASMELPKMDLVGIADAKLSFRYGHIQRYDSIQNNLRITISSNCLNPQTIWSKSGADLSTGGLSNGNYNFNSLDCTNDTVITVNLSSYIGQENIAIKFIAEGQYNSILLLDSISITSSTLKCAVPKNPHLSNKTNIKGTVTWDRITNGEGYHLQWRSKNSTIWQDVALNYFLYNNFTITNLSPGNTYEWRVRGNCTNGISSNWTPIQTFTTYTTFCSDIEITDLKITSVASDRIHYTFKVTNTGNKEVYGRTVWVQPYASSDSQLGNDYMLEKVNISVSLKSQASRISDWSSPFNTMDYNYLILSLDNPNILAECNETNNVRIIQFTDLPCPSTLNINNTPIEPNTYQAVNTLNSTGRIDIGTNVVFKAGQAITLQTGFHAQAGSRFTAMIEDCPPNNLEEETTNSRLNTKITSNYASKALAIQVSPNPVRHQATIDYELSAAGNVQIFITDLQGKLVTLLKNDNYQSVGKHQMEFFTEQLNKGMYLVIIETQNGGVGVQKMVLLK